uniref:Uncharacterized protein n=1 Tax=Triticum urartu TaxID=4572 RepID=A0A8R7UDP0_TRIUA
AADRDVPGPVGVVVPGVGVEPRHEPPGDIDVAGCVDERGGDVPVAGEPEGREHATEAVEAGAAVLGPVAAVEGVVGGLREVAIPEYLRAEAGVERVEERRIPPAATGELSVRVDRRRQRGRQRLHGNSYGNRDDSELEEALEDGGQATTGDRHRRAGLARRRSRSAVLSC